MQYDVFISYSRRDKEIAERICAAFDLAKVSYFIDRQGIGGGMEFPTVLSAAICESRLFLFLGSKDSYKSKFTNSEIIYAFNKKDNHSLVPYLIDKTPLPDNLELVFSSINWRNIEEHPIELLVDDILRLLGREAYFNAKYTPMKVSRKSDINKYVVAAVAVAVVIAAIIFFVIKGDNSEPSAVAEAYRSEEPADSQGTTTEKPISEPAKAKSDSRPSAPVSSQTPVVQPAQPVASQPVVSQPAQPVASQPSQPSQPEASQPAQPVTSQPVQPVREAAPAPAPAAEVSASELVAKGVAAVRKFKPEQAVGLFKQAADKGSAEACYHLGELYYNGNGVSKSFPTAAMYFEKAANAGMADAQYMLGLMYRNGQGVSKDISMASFWLQCAADKGHAKASQMLKQM